MFENFETSSFYLLEEFSNYTIEKYSSYSSPYYMILYFTS